MPAKYIIRLDDACPTMHKEKWQKFEKLFDKYGITPVVSVVPDNKDEALVLDKENSNFWPLVNTWISKGWSIAMHGYQHLYTSKNSGIMKFNNYSEFAGLPYEQQSEKIENGIKILREKGINPSIWIAPAHSFDENTLKALKQHTDIKIISDGIAVKPFNKYNFVWVPQQFWHPRQMVWGVWTICYHPNTATDKDLAMLDAFFAKNAQNFTNIETYSNTKRRIGILDIAFAASYYLLFNMKMWLNDILGG